MGILFYSGGEASNSVLMASERWWHNNMDTLACEYHQIWHWSNSCSIVSSSICSRKSYLGRNLTSKNRSGCHMLDLRIGKVSETNFVVYPSRLFWFSCQIFLLLYRLEIILSKADFGVVWSEVIIGSQKGEEILDSSFVEEVHQRLAHLCSDTVENAANGMDILILFTSCFYLHEKLF